MSTEEQLRAELDAAKSWISGDSVRIGELRRELERVTAERDHLKSLVFDGDLNFSNLTDEYETLRARVAELEREIERNAWTLSPEMVQTRNDQLAAENGALEQRNAELVAALREEKRIHPEDFQLGDFRERAIARAESATPAKHPDTAPVRRFRIGLCQKCGESFEHGHECDSASEHGGPTP